MSTERSDRAKKAAPECSCCGNRMRRGHKWECSDCGTFIDDGKHFPSDDLLEAAKSFLAKMDAIEASPEYRSIWEVAFLHGCKYQGEKWDVARERLRAAIAGKEGGQ